MHRKVAAALCAVFLLAAAGCGDSSEQLTRAQLTNRIEAACRQAQVRTEEASRRADDFLAAALVGQEALLERIEALDPPEELSDEVDTLKANLEQRNEMISGVVDAPRAEQGRAVEALGEQAEAVTRDLDATMRRLGVSDCT